MYYTKKKKLIHIKPTQTHNSLKYYLKSLLSFKLLYNKILTTI